MNAAAIWLLVLAVLLLGFAATVFFGSRQIDINQAVRARFRGLTMDAAVTERRQGRQYLLMEWWLRKLQRAGLDVSRKTSLAIFGPLVAAGIAGVTGWGVKGLWLPVAVIAGVHIHLEHRSRLRREAMLAQLPGFVDHVIRGLSVGRTVENTVLLATEQCRPPLRDILERVRVNVELGAHLSEELRQVARIHRLRELQLLALAVHVNQRFGGSARELLQSIVTMIEQRDQAQRELRALTGETRVSAWVLGLLPVSVAAYMLAMNPGYLEVMWLDAGGRKVLLVALGMQCIGAALLWRMVRSL
jgi:tight adherence protein B